MSRAASVMAGVMAVLCVAGVATAADDGWKFEVTPYAWFVGIDADVKAGNRSADVDVGFGDLIDKVDLAGEIFLTAQKDQWVVWMQADYLSLSADASTHIPTAGGTLPVSAEADLDSFFLAGGFGYQFQGGLTKKATTDVLLGARYASLDASLTLDAPAAGVARTVDGDADIVDVVLFLRPRVPITDKLDFNPTISIGTGDSDLVWELQPHLQYAFTDTWAGRIGYRRLVYDVKGDRVEFDGSFHGFILGVGATF